MPIKTWVASRDGKLWASNRTRDVLDLSFNVYKHNPGEPCRVEVKRCYEGGQRAKVIIGWFEFSDSKVAKEMIESMVLDMYIRHRDQKAARKDFLETMLVASDRGRFVGDDGNMTVKSDVEVEAQPTVQTPELEVVDLTPSQEAINAMMDAFDMNKAVEVMMENIEEIEEAVHPLTANILKEVTEKLGDTAETSQLTADIKEAFSILVEAEKVAAPVIEPEIPKTITIGGKEINIGWPS
jgi:hypothetical protein